MRVLEFRKRLIIIKSREEDILHVKQTNFKKILLE